MISFFSKIIVCSTDPKNKRKLVLEVAPVQHSAGIEAGTSYGMILDLIFLNVYLANFTHFGRQYSQCISYNTVN